MPEDVNRLLSDGAGALHLTGLGDDDRRSPDLLFSAWDGQRRDTEQPFRLDVTAAEIDLSAVRKDEYVGPKEEENGQKDSFISRIHHSQLDAGGIGTSNSS